MNPCKNPCACAETVQTFDFEPGWEKGAARDFTLLYATVYMLLFCSKFKFQWQLKNSKANHLLIIRRQNDLKTIKHEHFPFATLI